MPEISVQKQCLGLTSLTDTESFGTPIGVTEFCHLLKGHWVLTSASGQITELRAGDSWVFPRGWKGTSEVVETVRKAYLIVSYDQ